jgi:serine protease
MNRIEVSVVVQEVSEVVTTNGGYHFILLVDPDTYETIEQVDSAGEDGVYDFQFSGVPGGETYVIYAGTDPNNDDLICDNGEACGAYISLDQPAELTVTGDMSGLDFMTDINIALPEVSTSRFAEAALPLQRKVLKGVAEGPDQNSRLLTRISPP